MRLLLGIFAIVFGILFATVRNIEYSPGDVRGSDAYHYVVGALAFVVGVWLILSIRYPTLRGPWRRDG